MQSKRLTESGADFLQLSRAVAEAKARRAPIVALESAVITHGLPYPHNLELAQELENLLRSQGVTPATVGVWDGHIQVGLEADQIASLAGEAAGLQKASGRDLALAVVKRERRGTTVAGTLVAAHAAGLRVFATGGIGGVHRQLPGEARASFDISADLPQMAATPLVVVCAGAKAILDLPATLEYLETCGVPVLGYQTDEFPAFYSLSSGLKASARVDSAGEVVQIARRHWQLGLRSAVLVVVPPPAETALPLETVERAVSQALEDAQAEGIRGPAVTPYLLGRISALTGGASLQANLGLLRKNTRVAGEIARQFSER